MIEEIRIAIFPIGSSENSWKEANLLWMGCTAIYLVVQYSILFMNIKFIKSTLCNDVSQDRYFSEALTP